MMRRTAIRTECRRIPSKAGARARVRRARGGDPRAPRAVSPATPRSWWRRGVGWFRDQPHDPARLPEAYVERAARAEGGAEWLLVAEAGGEALDRGDPAPAQAGERDAHDVASGGVLAEGGAEARDEGARAPAAEAAGDHDRPGGRVRREARERGDRAAARRASLAPAARKAVGACPAPGVDEVELI